MRIGIIASHLVPKPGSTHAPIPQLVDGLRAAHHDVYVATPHLPHIRVRQQNHVPLFATPLPHSNTKTAPFIPAAQLRRFMIGLDLIHLHSFPGAEQLILQAAQLQNVPVVLTLASNDPCTLTSLQGASVITTPEPEYVTELRARSTTPLVVLHVPHPATEHRLRPARHAYRQELRLPARSTLLLTDDHAYESLFPALHLADPAVYLACFTDDFGRAEGRKLAVRHRVSRRVRFLMTRSRWQYAAAVAAADYWVTTQPPAHTRTQHGLPWIQIQPTASTTTAVLNLSQSTPRNNRPSHKTAAANYVTDTFHAYLLARRLEHAEA